MLGNPASSFRSHHCAAEGGCVFFTGTGTGLAATLFFEGTLGGGGAGFSSGRVDSEASVNSTTTTGKVGARGGK